MSCFKLLSGFLTFCLIVVAVASAATIHIPAEQPSIQAGIDVAVNGDTVLVASGTYTGDGNRDLNTLGKAITVKSELGPEVTVISCGGTEEEPHIGFLFENSETGSTVIDGFTVTGAYSDIFMSWPYGAVSCISSSPAFKNCHISGNGGPGVLSHDWEFPEFTDCKITDNDGHGVVLGSGHVRLTRCVIAGNNLDGVNVDFSGEIHMDECLVYRNGGDGIFAATFFDDLQIRNSTFYGNNRGLFWDFNFPKNESGPDPERYNDLNIRNNVFAFNRTYGVRAHSWENGNVVAACNNSFGNPSGDWFADPFYSGDEFGNFSSDPLFQDTTGNDFCLTELSPCLPPNNECDSLLGAVGLCGEIPCGDLNGDGAVNILDILYYIDWKFSGGPPPVDLTKADVNSDGSYNVLDILHLVAYKFNIPPGVEPNCP